MVVVVVVWSQTPIHAWDGGASVCHLIWFSLLQVGWAKKWEAQTEKRKGNWEGSSGSWEGRWWRIFYEGKIGKFIVLFILSLGVQGRHGPYYPPPPPGPVIYCNRPVRKPNPLVAWYKNFHFQAKKIDVVSRVAFPFAFALFNAYYWSYYLTRKQGHPES